MFPIVRCGQKRLATVRCARLSPKDYPAGRALVLARDDREIERVLADARFGESIGLEITLPVWVRFIPQRFFGQSYGLALALADKRTRYCSYFNSARGRLIATGHMIEDGCGKVGEVAKLHDCLAAIAAEVLPGDHFVFPKANLRRVSPIETVLLEDLKRKGIEVTCIDHFNQIKELYT